MMTLLAAYTSTKEVANIRMFVNSYNDKLIRISHYPIIGQDCSFEYYLIVEFVLEETNKVSTESTLVGRRGRGCNIDLTTTQFCHYLKLL
jgi:hypothetical protein